MNSPVRTDVVVVGAGNAAFSAALAARDRGREVVMLEAAPREQAGGNSYYTAGATRIAHDGLEDLTDLVEADERHARSTVPPYTRQNYIDDLAKVTEGRGDVEMAGVLADEAADALRWLHSAHGMRYRLMYERQAYERPDGTFLFWGGLHVGNVGGGEGMIADYVVAAERAGLDVRYGHKVTDLLVEDGRVVGVRASTADGVAEFRADSVVLASGGFESDPGMREQHLGKGWANAKLRGTPFNTGILLQRAIDLGAARGGDWSSCHATAWDAWAENNESNRELTNRLTRQSYPLGVVVNREGRRFVDEGADYRNYTYAKYGAEILKEPGSIAFQLFDATLRPMLRSEEYDMPGVGVVEAGTLTELAERAGIDADQLVATIEEFNASIDRSVKPDPNVKDGRKADVQPPKSNWAYPIETAPFYAYPVTCGITFTFGGLKGDLEGRVLREDGSPVEGLFACGEALGGLFSGNYPGGSGLAAGAVFGRRAGNLA
ncbi:FAD-dependent tricarballylate dehydrogenase TcuA [Georgenia subflava]|uniref:FAD-dependent oxidoreductase n=1 Tax=Georgenia subflava TaxID=1622177 RepID=A0A6N7ER14_9MICO|nr:FAD-dependent tricarballylate dehydrogenase TcuA [Georgenia subflava]MPV38556.1 FAD-dependent oxidoreductase [Georgenia subflava]